MTDESTLDPMRELVLKTLRERPTALFEDVLNLWARQRGRPSTGPEVDRLWAIYSDASPTLTAPRPSRPAETARPRAEPVVLPVTSASVLAEAVPGPSDLPGLRATVQSPPATRPADGATGSLGSQLLLPAPAPWPPRVVALMIDGLLLAIVGQLVGLFFAEPLYMAGAYGRWIGLLLVLTYFGVGTSAIAGGQTLAMRLFGIAVRSNDGTPIDLPRALARSLVFVAPIMAAGLTALGVRGSPLATAAQAILVLGLGLGGIAFTIGNRRRCQALHDVLCSTQVVRLSAAPVEAYPGTPRRILTNVLPMALALTLLAASSLALGAAVRSGNDELRELERELAQDPRVVEVSASLASSEAGPAAKWVELDVWHRGSITEEQRADLTADLAHATFARIDDIDAVQVTIVQGFDIGIARRGASWTSAIAAANQP